MKANKYLIFYIHNLFCRFNMIGKNPKDYNTLILEVTPGYARDTQSDMLYAFIGSLAPIILLSGYHDARINEIGGR